MVGSGYFSHCHLHAHGSRVAKLTLIFLAVFNPLSDFFTFRNVTKLSAFLKTSGRWDMKTPSSTKTSSYFSAHKSSCPVLNIHPPSLQANGGNIKVEYQIFEDIKKRHNSIKPLDSTLSLPLLSLLVSNSGLCTQTCRPLPLYVLVGLLRARKRSP